MSVRMLVGVPFRDAAVMFCPLSKTVVFRNVFRMSSIYSGLSLVRPANVCFSLTEKGWGYERPVMA